MSVHNPHRQDRVALPAARTEAHRRRGSVTTTIAALIAVSLPVIAVVAPLAVETVAIADTNHPRWKDFVTWLMDKKRTPQEELILRYILSGGPGFTWLNVYSHSMQEQTEALFRRWLEGHGNPRQIPNLSDRPIGNSRG